MNDQPPTLLALLSPRVARHFVIALAHHGQWCHRNGEVMPPELVTLLEHLTANGAQRGSFRADTSAPVEAVAMTYTQAAAALRCSPRTIGRMTRDGRLQAVGSGSGRRIPASEVKRYARTEGAA